MTSITAIARPLLMLTLCLAGQVATGAAAPELYVAEPAMREIRMTGFTRAVATLPLVAETAGRVEEVRYDIGEAIADDTEGRGLFARIDDTFLRLDLDEVRVTHERLESQIAYDRREVERYQELAKQKNASASQLDTLEQALRNNRHELMGLEVRRQVLEERIARTRVLAPAGWRVTQRSIEPGQWVGEGERIGEVSDFSTLIVPFALTPEQHAALSRMDGDLSLMLPDLEQAVAAEIYRTNPGFDAQTRKIQVELAIREPVEPRRGGLRARLALAIPERTDAVMLPAAAVEQSYDELWITREDGRRVRVILLGRSDDGKTVRVVASSLRPGDRLIAPLSGTADRPAEPAAQKSALERSPE